ncbi:MAG: LmeA family phospholipid-binding protein [Acidimicrobiales bacterium]
MIPGRGCLRAMLILVVGLGVLGNIGDVAARHWATSKVEQRVRAVVPNAQGVHAHIRSWPFLKVVVTGRIDEMGGRIDRVTVNRLAFSDVEVEIHGLKVEVSPLISHGKVVVDHINSGSVSVSITAADLGKALGLPVSAGAAAFAVNGVPIAVSVRTSSRQVVIAGAGAVFTYLLPDASLLPCLPSATFAHGVVTLSCVFDHVPSAFTDLA